MSTCYYYSMRSHAYTQLPEETTRQSNSHPYSEYYPHSRPPLYHHYTHQPEEEQHDTRSGWNSLSFDSDSWRTSWLARAIETMQIKWWHYRTGIGALESEKGVEESEYRRDERLVAASEGRPYHYDS